MTKLQIVKSAASSANAKGPVIDELAAILSEIGNQLNGASERLQESMLTPLQPGELQLPGHSSMKVDVKRARSLRQLRKKLLGDEYFSGPGWDVLLHLFESHLHQFRDTVGSACAGSSAAATTALRWINRLEQDRLILVRDDPLDARRRFVELTPEAIEIMTRYFTGANTHLIAA